MAQIHMSYLTKGGNPHGFLHRDADKKTLELLSYLKTKVSVPLVLECMAQTEEQIDWIVQEVKFLRAL